MKIVMGSNWKSDFLEIRQDPRGGTPRIQATGRAFKVANLVFLLSQQDVLAAVSNYVSPRNVDRCESHVLSRVNR